MTKEEISEMSAQERLDLIEALWDSLAPEDVPVPDWHKRILDERLAEHEREPDEGISLEEFRRELFTGRSGSAACRVRSSDGSGGGSK